MRRAFGEKSKIPNTEQVAMELQSQFNNETDDNINIFSDDLPLPMQSENIVGGQLDETDCLNEVQNDPAITGVEARIYESTAEIVERLEAQVDHSSQFYIVIRRGSTLQRKLIIWKRQLAKKESPKQKVMVSFAGEMGIDSGALAK